MIIRYKKWFNSLPPFKNLAFTFIVNWFFWLIIRLLADQFIFDAAHSWKDNFFHATWMSLFMIIPFNWNEIQKILKPKNKKNQNPKTDILHDATN